MPTQKTVLLTGSTGAIGRAAAEALARRGVKLVLLARDAARGEKVAQELRAASGNQSVEVLTGDLGDRASLKRAAEDFKRKHPRLDALVNVAAIYKATRVVDSQGVEAMFGTNHLGPFLLTNLLVEPLKAAAPSRIILVTAPSSTQLNFEDLQAEKKFGAVTQFGMSKACNLLFGGALARRLGGSNVSVMMFHPGVVKSSLMREMPKLVHAIFNLLSSKPDMPGDALARLALDPEYEKANGGFFKLTKPLDLPATAKDEAVQEKLWAESARLCGLA